jgi:hypothetical protein
MKKKKKKKKLFFLSFVVPFVRLKKRTSTWLIPVSLTAGSAGVSASFLPRFKNFSTVGRCGVSATARMRRFRSLYLATRTRIENAATSQTFSSSVER